MTDIEHRLRDAMHAAVDAELPPADLVTTVLRRHQRYRATVVALAVIGAIAVAAVPVAIGWRGEHHGPVRPGVSATASSPTLIRPSVSASPLPSRSPVHVYLHSEPAWMRGLPLPRTADVRLLLDGRAPAWYSLATGRIQPIAGLPPSQFPYSLTRVAGGWAALPSPKGHACAPDCPDPRLPVYYIADGLAAAQRVGETQELSPGAGRGQIWLETYPPGTHDMTKASATARLAVGSAWPLGIPDSLPAGYLIRQALGRYLLLSPVVQGPGPVIDKLWDPTALRVVRTFPDVIAAGANEVAWTHCNGCGVRVYDPRTRHAFTVAVPAGTWAYDGAFSADGRMLAVHLSAGITRDRGATLAGIGVIDTARHDLRILGGSAIGVNLPEALTFGWRGHELIAAVTGAGRLAQVASWRPGAAQLHVRKLRLPPGMTVTVGAYG